MSEQVLQGRTAIVTGSGQNIGKAIAKMFAAAGANVVVNGRSNEKIVDETVNEIRSQGGSAVGIMADVSDHTEVHEMVAETKRRFGTVDIVVNNVSIRRKQPFLEITPQDWDDTLSQSNLVLLPNPGGHPADDGKQMGPADHDVGH